MCFRPPEISSVMTRCPACQTFNPTKNEKCKKCGADMPKQPEAEKK